MKGSKIARNIDLEYRKRKELKEKKKSDVDTQRKNAPEMCENKK